MDQDWIGLRKFFCFDVIILQISKILVVIRFHRLARWQRCTAGRIFGFFELGLDWISFSFQPHSDPDHPNEINSGRAKILVWNNICMMKNYDLSKSYIKNLLV